MMFFWSEVPRWIYAVILIALLAIAGIVFSVVRGQVSTSAGAVQYMDDYNQKGSTNPREMRRTAPAGGFAPRPGEQPHNTVIKKEDRQQPFVPSQSANTPAPQDRPGFSPRGGREGRN
jgi:hypothetical protein